MSDESNNQKQDRKGLVALALVGLVAGMVGMSFAAVPLYRIFCQTTGYGGATQRADAATGEVLDRTITIRFDANVDRDLPWTFEPVQRTYGRQDRRERAGLLQGAQQHRQARDRNCRLQRRAGGRRAATSPRSSASASPGRRLLPVRA